MGIETVAIYSDVDAQLPHVHLADQAVMIGIGPAASSYLQADKIIALALELGVDAIHPGYGFLSENAAFAQQVTDAGMLFVGPSADAIRLMGSKIEAKRLARQYDIPLVPGVNASVSSMEEAKGICQQIGYPVLVKASAGGGGKGMRIVEQEEDLWEAIERARSEAGASFGDDTVFIEKYIVGPKHIEFQVLGDQHGHIVHLFERDCSIQRRHQKIVEEAPAAALTPTLRQEMADAAIRIAKACGYYSTGTVEFILDEGGAYYFLEMNTRLQVEHPVTEMITGLDLVREQIRVAEGHPLDFSQQELSSNGHAIELRVSAEDPLNNFLPDIGKIRHYIRPEGEGIRVDDGYAEGMEVPIYYDSMIAKLIVWAEDRPQAIERLRLAIQQYLIAGIQTTLPFGNFVLSHSEFVGGTYNTKFVEQFFDSELLDQELHTLSRSQLQAVAILSGKLFESPLPHPLNAETAWRERLRR